MKVILTEKPSVAKEIAAFVRARRRHDGYLEGGGYQVTWAYGHLVELQEPQDYDPSLKRWALETLPILPEDFRLKQAGDRRARQQFQVIKRLFHSADEIICATDAGREGELIFRYILSLSGCTHKPVRRLWMSSLTPDALRSAFQNLRPGTDYDRLYHAARCRSQADWIVGINATRSYTVRHGMQGLLWSVGRVQTPVLAMIVQRDDEIRTFRPAAFWELETRYRQVRFRFQGDRFTEPQPAEELLRRIQGQVFRITGIRTKTDRSQPPQLYDLTDLQRDLNRRYGMSADATLKAAQSLYEKQLITYPRTDSRYLGDDLKSRIPEILQQLNAYKSEEIERLDLNALSFTKRIFDDRKVTDHHAIIPTGNQPAAASAGERRVYDAILIRLIAAFYPPCLKEITTVAGVSQEIPFQARGVRVTQAGWTELYPRKSKSDGDEDADAQPLPEFQVGESGPHEPEVRQGETTPPKHFTENTLLAMMETAGRLVDDQQLREALKERGLGTPATRAAIIETLLQRCYIERSKKLLIATDLGRYLIAVVRGEELKSPELTGRWEAKLREIESGKLTADGFMSQIADFARTLIRQDQDRQIDSQRWGTCPRCGREVIQGKRGFGCSGWRDGCGFVIWPDEEGRKLTPLQVRQLLQLGLTAEPHPMPTGAAAVFALTATGAIVEVPLPEATGRGPGKPACENRRGSRSSAKRKSETASADGAKRLGACPLCQSDVLEQKKSFSCNRWKEGCPFVIWKTISGKKIGIRSARLLLQKGETGLLKGFQSKSGKPFSARLRLDHGQVRFVFDD